MTRYAKGRGYTERATLPEQMALQWHALHQRDATHPSRFVDELDWRNCRGCVALNPFHRAARLAAAKDIAARIVDSMVSTNATQQDRRDKLTRSNWRRKRDPL